MTKDCTGNPPGNRLTSGEVIKKYRLKNNLSRPELAKLMDLSRNTLMNWGKRQEQSGRQICPGTGADPGNPLT